MHDDRSPTTGRGGQFPSTRWSLVIQAGSPAAPLAREALTELCEAYWYPIYAFIRRKGNRHEDALDLTQAYFARLLQKPVIAAADPDKGRFRSFLRADCQHFLIDQHRRSKQDGAPQSVSINGDEAETRYRLEPVDPMTPERQIDRAWAVTVLSRALEQLAAEYESKGQAELFDQLKCVLAQNEEAVAVPVLAAQLGKTEGAVHTAVHRLRKRYAATVLREVASTLDEGYSAEDEIQSLFEALRP
jgi:RNA polymerase sigma factor (sigma-70 family)